MKAQLPSKERLEKIASWREKYGAGHNVMLTAEEAEALARFALSAHEQEPVAWWTGPEPTPTGEIESIHDHETGSHSIPLYPHPAPSIPAAVPDDADPRDAFERAFPMPKHAIRCGNGYACTEYNAWDAHKFVDRWEGWNAAMLNHSEGKLDMVKSEPVSNPYKLPDGWIPVRERLPLTPSADCTYRDIEVNVFDGERVFTAHYEIGSRPQLWGKWEDTYAKITHWQPLPVAPKVTP